MKIAVAKEIDPSEPRVAASPDTVKKFKALGAEVVIEPGSGLKSGLPDSDFTAAGATVSADALKDVDIIIEVKRPEASELSKYKRGALVVAIMDPYGNDAALKAMADAGISAFAMELMPRITRAQVMDVLSSQANLAGYRAVIEGAEAFGRAFPMMMTAAGTIPAEPATSTSSPSQPSDVHDGPSLVFPRFAEVFTALASGTGNTAMGQISGDPNRLGCATHPCLSRVSCAPIRCFASPPRPTRRSVGVLQTCLAKLSTPAERPGDREVLRRRTL
jgi:hypothetical protein